MSEITLTPAMLDAIRSEIDSMPNPGHVREILVGPRNGSTLYVTLDGGYGTYSFVVNRNGKVVGAGLGVGAFLADA